MKILLFGKNGQVGWELNRSLQPLGEVVAFGREEADFSNPESLRDVVRNIKPDVIVNAVAYTAVDKAEEEEELATIINGVAPGVLAEEAKKLNALLVHYSTDYVFDGTKGGPYVETDVPKPVNAYGRSKLAGEQAIQSSKCDYLIFRASWVYAARGNNFLLTITKFAKEIDKLSIVADQIGSPTSARLIAETTFCCVHQALKVKRAGNYLSNLYHLTTSGYASWHGFAEEIVKLENEMLGINLKVKEIKAIMTVDYPTLAKRPLCSQLTIDKLKKDYEVVMPDWRVALRICIEELICDQ